MSGIDIGIGVAIVLLLWTAPLFVAATITRDKGRGATTGVLLGFFLGWIGVVIAAILSPTPGQTRRQGVMRECPHCKEDMKCDAGTCPHCRKESSPWSLRDGHWYRQGESGWQAIEDRTNERTWESKFWLNVALVLIVLIVIVLIAENHEYVKIEFLLFRVTASTIWLILVSVIIGLVIGAQGSRILQRLSYRNSGNSTINLGPRYFALLVAIVLGMGLFLGNRERIEINILGAFGHPPVMWFVLLCIAIGLIGGVLVSQLSRSRENQQGKLSKEAEAKTSPF
jgi:uncharacterized integral membrane protein